MILGQIGKGCHIIDQAAHPLQANGMAGYLHDHMGTAGIPHFGKQCLQIQALGGSALCGDPLVADHIFHGAHQTHLGAPDSFQHML